MRSYRRRTTWFSFFNDYELHEAKEEQQNQRITLKPDLRYWARRQNIKRYDKKQYWIQILYYLIQ